MNRPGPVEGAAVAPRPALAAEVRARGVPPQRQYVEKLPEPFLRNERATTTMLLFGLTGNHDQCIGAAARAMGYRVEVLQTPDNDCLALGKAYCDRGMCNPVTYAVGRLLQYLNRLRDEQGLSSEQIRRGYLLAIPNGCGPCRFTLYINEYRKALRDAGYEGFRVLLFNQALLDNQSTAEAGLKVDGRFFYHLIRSIIVADILNLRVCRTRPYEVEPGATNAAGQRSLQALTAALERNAGVLAALATMRREFAAVAVDRRRIKPKVGVIGEIWAQSTDGDGNYRLRTFLEEEGAEVEVQSVTSWILVLIWEAVHDTLLRAGLPAPRFASLARPPLAAWRRALGLRAVAGIIRVAFHGFAWLAGVRGCALPRIERLARLAHPYYNVTQRGGEMFFEVAKLLQYIRNRSAHMVVSVKPFGCMPSSGVSDGVQSLINERHPHVLFLPIETTGEGAVNVYSRLQMQLFKAKQMAAAEHRPA